MVFKKLLFIVLLLMGVKAYSQQDVIFHLNAHLFNGTKILKVKRDFYDPYLWVLAQNNQVYRVNSLTLAIDDYTSQFAAYSNLQFIDIAGRSQDTVFIATNSTNVIQYKSGAIKLVGSGYGITDTVNSIGVDYSSAVYPTFRATVLTIATNNNIYRYNMDTEQPVVLIDVGTTKVYEATYRREMIADSNMATKGSLSDTISYLPVLSNGYGDLYRAYLWEGGKAFGYHIRTAYFVPGIMYNFQGEDDPIYMDLFWGNDKGMFQLSDVNCAYEYDPYGHYLDGITVNKITSIYGLAAFGNGHQFGNPGFIKDNLLIGTNSGLYFSNSVYDPINSINDLRIFSLFHDDELGNIVINDICVNVASAQEPICEDGAWLAADDGLYLIKPDYNAYLNAKQLQSIAFANQPDTVSAINVCLGDIAKAYIDTSSYTGNSFQWYKNGQELPAQSSDTLTISTAGDYYAVLYDPCTGIHVESNHLQVNIITNPVFTFNYPDIMQLCSNTPDVLQVTYNAAYHYQWYTNDILNGDTSNTFDVTQSGKYKVEVSACPNSWVPSKEVAVDMITLPMPRIIADKPSYCVGDNATLSIATPANSSYTINWYKDNVLLNNNINQTSIITNVSGNYTVSVVNNTANTDGSTCSQASAVEALTFNPIPTVSIEEIAKTTLCDGQTISLLAHYTGGTVQWSTGETTDQISVDTSGTYTATVTSAAGCAADNSISIQFSPNPVLSLSDTSICTYTKQTVTLTAPPGVTGYNWNNGLSTQQTYTVTTPQTVTLTVTDANGCQATQQIKITEQCGEVFIPNTFTPNGDGINDTWVIGGLDESASVRVFTRYGTLIYESKGYNTPWNGEYAGKKLPTGVYYYIITAKNGIQKFSGALTIIY